ncbi:MAG TPA: GGDEF domain-containing protein [Sulfurospirillum sp. UBA12182]|nr:MAG TPA: GGDEF domain-containing protein [Sulfurospirillum sp. UBA12182]
MYDKSNLKKELDIWRIVAIYLLFALLWIFFSDSVLEFFVTETKTLSVFQTYKGVFFVLSTSVILYFLIKRYVRHLIDVQRELEETKQRLEYVIKGANLGYWDWDYKSDKQVVNDKWLSFLGLQPDDIGYDIQDWSKRIHPDDMSIAQKALEQTMSDSQPYVIEFRMKHKDGHYVWIEGSGAVVARDNKDGSVLRLAGTHKDISTRKEFEKEIRFLALNDVLTRLPNRTFLKQKMEEKINKTPDLEFAFLFLDLDYFKNINDIYGHSKGDYIIQQVATRLQKALLKNDFIARVGGDEFVVLIENLENLKSQCQLLFNALEEPFIINNEHNKIGVSIGIALYPKDGNTLEELFKNADTAMYVAKNSGKNRYCFYHPSMTDNIYLSTKFDSELKEAIKNEEFILHYQPQIDLQTNKLIGLEALVRWQKADGEMIGPDTFIKQSEENKMIIEIGEIVMKKAFMTLKEFQEEKSFQGTMAINISAVQIDDIHFISQLEKRCKDANISPSFVELEITESYIMYHPEKSIEILDELHQKGFKISIDDFGTGYSSLSYLKKLPVDKLKIDRSFIKDLPQDSEDSAITKTIITLAKNLNLEVIAEGVETQAQDLFLKENGCDSVQGYFYAKPMDKARLEEYFKSLV